MATQEELEKTLKELDSLEKRYIGCTPEQTKTAQLLKNNDLNYQLKKQELDAKVRYLKAKLENEKKQALISKMNYNDSYRDAMMDDIFG